MGLYISIYFYICFPTHPWHRERCSCEENEGRTRATDITVVPPHDVIGLASCNRSRVMQGPYPIRPIIPTITRSVSPFRTTPPSIILLLLLLYYATAGCQLRQKHQQCCCITLGHIHPNPHQRLILILIGLLRHRILHVAGPLLYSFVNTLLS